VLAHFLLGFPPFIPEELVLASESWHKGSNAVSVMSLVVDEER